MPERLFKSGSASTKASRSGPQFFGHSSWFLFMPCCESPGHQFETELINASTISSSTDTAINHLVIKSFICSSLITGDYFEEGC